MIKTILEGATIIDGTGYPRYSTDLGLVEGRIGRIGDCTHIDAVKRIDCRGLIVAPAFIDASSQAQGDWQQPARYESQVAQGITTAIVPNAMPVEQLPRIAGDVDTALLISRSTPAHITQFYHADMERVLEEIDRARDHGAQITCDTWPYTYDWVPLSSARPSDAIEALGIETYIKSLGDPGARVLLPVSNEDGVAMLLSASFCAIGTGAIPLRRRDEQQQLVHPRTFGSCARIFGRFVRQRRALTTEEAVRRMTSLPAEIFGLEGVGRIAEEAAADLVLFEEGVFADTATYERPLSLPVGLARVFAAGEEIYPFKESYW